MMYVIKYLVSTYGDVHMNELGILRSRRGAPRYRPAKKEVDCFSFLSFKADVCTYVCTDIYTIVHVCTYITT
jgi:hypothetical protein